MYKNNRQNLKQDTYQKGFYRLSEKVRDKKSRLEIAEKIAYLLREFSSLSLSSSICLDIGCADGTVTQELAQMFSSIIGLEYDVEALANISMDSANRAIFLRADGMDLPFNNSSFDIILCAQVYEHVSDDKQLFIEIERVLKPNGIVFFSGPNLLFPIEPHYFIPFLHWLPKYLANAYLRLLGRGDTYYENLRSLWGLRRIMGAFRIIDVTIPVLRWKAKKSFPHFSARIIQSIPVFFWRLLLPLIPNYNWLLQKAIKKSRPE